MLYINFHPYLMDPNPATVLENIKNSAITYYHATGHHLDLRTDIPQQMQLLSTDTSSFQSAQDSDLEDVPKPKWDAPRLKQDDPSELTEAELEKQEREFEAMVKRREAQKKLRERKEALEARRKALEDSE
jgi:hypothetical protein